MLSQRTLETTVGLFVLAAIFSFIFLAFKVSGLTHIFTPPSYHLYAQFDDIGQLKSRAPVKMGGVKIGQVSDIKLDSITYKAIVTLDIENQFATLPNDSSASILTAGLLGDNYVALTPMYSKVNFKDGDEIQYTHSAMVLEKLIGQFLFKIGNDNSDKNKK